MIKKKTVLLLALSVTLLVSSCRMTNNGGRTIPFENISDFDKSILAYKEFLEEGRKVQDGDKTIVAADIFRFDTEVDRNNNKYAIFDMNGDRIPELHVRSSGEYYIITYKLEDLYVWNEASSYSYPNNDKAILTTRPGGAPEHISYAYHILDYFGHEALTITFEKYDANGDGRYTADDLYLFDEVEVNKGTWERLTERYLSAGNDDINWRTFIPNTELDYNTTFIVYTLFSPVNADDLIALRDGKVIRDEPFFDMLEPKVLQELIDYLNDNGYVIAQWKYKLNPKWSFEQLLNEIKPERLG